MTGSYPKKYINRQFIFFFAIIIDLFIKFNIIIPFLPVIENESVYSYNLYAVFNNIPLILSACAMHNVHIIKFEYIENIISFILSVEVNLNEF